ncbi:MAG: serine--tRNA ligase, partial [Parcubacteria group bacterium CG10_big_fil_rev_8_21_14_0_10_36_14]
MLDIKFIRENAKLVKQSIKNRNKKADVDQILELDKERRELIAKIDEERMKARAQRVGNLVQDIKNKVDMKTLKKRQILFKVLHKQKQEIKKLEEKLKATEELLKIMIQDIPNIPQEDVPVGVDESANKQVRKVGAVPKLKNPKDHEELGKALDIIDTERATKISGSRFCYLKGASASLQFALIQYTHDLLVKKEKFVPIIPP